MEFPFGHHHHHHRRDDDDDDFERRQVYPPPDSAPAPYFQDPDFPPPPPRPHYQINEFAPPPPDSSVHRTSHNVEFQSDYPPPPPNTSVRHTSHNVEFPSDYPPPPPRSHHPENYYEAPPPPPETHVYHTSHNQQLDSDYPRPPPTQVTHLSHEKIDPEIKTGTHHSFMPHLPSFHTHHTSLASGLDFSNKPTYKVYCKAQPNFHLTIKDGKVVLARSDPSDSFQNWYKDEKFSTSVKDEEGFPSFALVNKASGQAMKHSIGDTHPVQLIPYNPDILDESVLWSESQDLGDGYRTVRMINNIRLNVDAFHGDKRSGGVHDGTVIVLWKLNKGDNQRWRITPHCKFLNFRFSNFVSDPCW